MFVYPAPGLFVRDPAKKDLLPESGREVSADDFYWHRRIADGDVVTELPQAPSAPAGKRNRSEEA